MRTHDWNRQSCEQQESPDWSWHNHRQQESPDRLHSRDSLRSSPSGLRSLLRRGSCSRSPLSVPPGLEREIGRDWKGRGVRRV